MAMPLAIIGTNFDKAFQQHAHAKSLKDKDWAKNQLRLLAEVTMKERRQRSLHLGYQIAEEVGELNDWEEQWEPQRKHQSNTDAELQAKSELLGALFEDALILSNDLNVLFRLNYQEVKAKQQETNATDENEEHLDGSSKTIASQAKREVKLSKEEKRAVGLVLAGKKEIADMHKFNAKHLTAVRTAVTSKKCRDKIWLCTEVPHSSMCADVYKWFSLGMTLLSILLFLCETTPEFNDYREGGRVCKQVVKYHCNKIYNKYNNAPASIKKQAYLSNLGCWSSDFQREHLNITTLPSYQVVDEDAVANNVTNPNPIANEEYVGCFQKNGFTTAELDEKCQWPAPHLGFTCDSELKWNSPTGRGIKNRRSKEDIALHGTKIYQTDWKNPFHHDWSKRENDHAERGALESDKWTSAYGNEHGTTTDIEIDVCEREQCIDNDGSDWAAEFFFVSGVFVCLCVCVFVCLCVCVY